MIKLISALNGQHMIKDPLLCLNDILWNEQVSSSCFSGGIALPHARTDGTEKLASAIGIYRTPVCFSSAGKESPPIRVIILSVCPRQAHELYLQYISHVASKVSAAEKIDRMTRCISPGDVRAFLKQEKDE